MDCASATGWRHEAKLGRRGHRGALHTRLYVSAVGSTNRLSDPDSSGQVDARSVSVLHRIDVEFGDKTLAGSQEPQQLLVHAVGFVVLEEMRGVFEGHQAPPPGAQNKGSWHRTGHPVRFWSVRIMTVVLSTCYEATVHFGRH